MPKYQLERSKPRATVTIEADTYETNASFVTFIRGKAPVASFPVATTASVAQLTDDGDHPYDIEKIEREGRSGVVY